MPVSGTSVTTRFFGPSSRATSIAAHTATPAEPPARIASSLARRSVICHGVAVVRRARPRPVSRPGRAHDARSSTIPSTSVAPLSPAQPACSGAAPTIAHVRHVLAQEARDAAERPARADARDERVDLPAQSARISRPRRRVVRVRVRGVLELVGVERAELLRERLGCARCIPRGPSARRPRARARSPRRTHGAPRACRSSRLRQDDDAAVSADRAHQREPDAGVARARLDDRGARRQAARAARRPRSSRAPRGL